MLRSFALGVVSSLALLSAANAADIYSAPASGGYKDAPAFFSWEGVYVGVNGGYGWSGNSKLFFEDEAFPGGIPAYVSTYGHYTSDGGFGGGQLGYNFQRGRLVFGVEADFQGAGILGKTSPQLSPDPSVNTATAAISSELDWFGTVRGRLGYTVSNVLIYATGGFAYGSVKDSLTVGPDAVGFTASAASTSTLTGYVAGGGFEYAINPSWSLKGEYQYINLGRTELYANTNPSAPAGADATVEYNHTYQTVRLGLNYHIGTAYEPLK